MKLLLITLLIAAGIGAALFALQALKRPRVMPYSEVRRKLIKGLADPAAAPTPRARPSGLDFRLDRARGAELRRIGPLTEANWREANAIFQEVVDSIEQEHQAIDPERSRLDLLSPGRRAVFIAYWLEAEVNNGGFDQFYLNSAGDGAADAPAALRLLGQEELARMVEEANRQFPTGPSPIREVRLSQLEERPPGAPEAWEKLGNRFYDLPFPFGGMATSSGIAYILKNEGEFFRP